LANKSRAIFCFRKPARIFIEGFLYFQVELADKLAYEQCARPLPLQQMMKINEDEKLRSAEETRIRQEGLAIKFDKIHQWKKDLENKIAKKKRDAEESKLKKDRMVEEVRRMVGYTLDPRDEKFKMLIEQKEKEQKKQEKEEKKALKAAKMMELMMAKGKTAGAEKTEIPPPKPKSS
jgi:Growth arrest and DNA-damage-inducible proteins-interacting protein 1